jgi:hypothetical protein
MRPSLTRNRWFAASPLEGDGFELVWGFPCQVVFFDLLPVLRSEREVAVLHPVACNQVPGARANGVSSDVQLPPVPCQGQAWTPLSRGVTGGWVSLN